MGRIKLVAILSGEAMKNSLILIKVFHAKQPIVILILLVLAVATGGLFGLGYEFISFTLLALLSGLIILPILFRKPEWLLSGIIISAPLPFIQIDIGIMIVTLSEIFLFVSVIVLILRVIAGRAHFPRTVLTWPVLVLGGMFIIGFIRFPEWTFGAYELGSLKTVYAFMMGILIYFLSLDSINNTGKRKFIVYSWAVSAGVAVFIGWYFYFTGQVSFREDLLITGLESPLGIAHGSYLMYVISMILPLAALVKDRVVKSVLWTVIINSVIQIASGAQRAPWISLIFVFIAFFFLSRSFSNRLRAKIFYVSLTAILVFTFFLSISFLVSDPLENQRVRALSSALSGGDVSSRNRSLIWAHTIKLISQRPLDGYGLRAFRRLYLSGEYQNSVIVSLGERGLAVHNTFLEITLDLGLPGLIILFWLLWAGIMKGRQIFKFSQNPIDTAIGLGALLAILHFCVWGLTDTLLIKLVENNFLFFSAFGILGSFGNADIPAV